MRRMTRCGSQLRTNCFRPLLTGMSRASPLPRSGDRSKAVMVGVIGRLLAVGGIVIRGGRAVKGTRCVIDTENDLPRSASTIVAQPVLEARTSGAPDPGPPEGPGRRAVARGGRCAPPAEVRGGGQGVRPGGPGGADTDVRVQHVGQNLCGVGEAG